MNPPKGDEETVHPLRVYYNGQMLVSCWQLTEEEIKEVAKTGKIFVSIMGHGMPPILIGSETSVRSFSADYGKVWPKSE